MSWKSKLKKIGKVAAVAAPIVAAPFTGGASLLAIGAGAGAAKGALDGKGWKGILGNAALGAGEAYGGQLLKGGSYNPLSDAKNVHAPLFGVGAGGRNAATTGRVVQNGPAGTVDTAHGTAGAASQGIGASMKSGASKLLSDPKLYYGALAALQDNNPGDSKRAYHINPEDSLNRAFSSARALQSQIMGRLDNPNYYYNTAATNFGPAKPVNVNGLQVAGGLHTTPEEEQLRREQEMNAPRG